MDNDIREPDEIKTDILINNPNILTNNNSTIDAEVDSDIEIENALRISEKEFNNVVSKNEEQFNDIIRISEEEHKRRFQFTKIQVSKIMKLDKVNVDIYLHILSIIKLYEEGFAVIPLSNEEYTNTLKIIETIRIPIEEKINFKNIIQKIE
mgnify:CR=1 FL=1